MNHDTHDEIPLEWQVGDVILGKYEIRDIFEGGGMGLVYRAYDREWDVEMAIKSPRANYFKTQEQIDRFHAEAEKWMELGMHPNITTCYYVQAIGTVPRPFAEYLEGGSLADWIENTVFPRFIMQRVPESSASRNEVCWEH